MEQLSEKKEQLGLRKTLVAATIALLIGLLACSGPAPTPETLGTRPPANSEATLEETATEASGQITTETPDLIDATTAPTTIVSVPKVTTAPTKPTSMSVPERTILAPNPMNPGVTAVPTPCDKPGYVGPHHGGCDLNPGADSHDNTGLYERASTSYNDPNHSRVHHPFRDIGIQQVPVEALGR